MMAGYPNSIEAAEYELLTVAAAIANLAFTSTSAAPLMLWNQGLSAQCSLKLLARVAARRRSPSRDTFSRDIEHNRRASGRLEAAGTHRLVSLYNLGTE